MGPSRPEPSRAGVVTITEVVKIVVQVTPRQTMQRVAQRSSRRAGPCENRGLRPLAGAGAVAPPGRAVAQGRPDRTPVGGPRRASLAGVRRAGRHPGGDRGVECCQLLLGRVTLDDPEDGLVCLAHVASSGPSPMSSSPLETPHSETK